MGGEMVEETAMTKHRVKRTRRAHPGVKVLKLGADRHVGRWTDPLTKKAKQVDLERLGLRSEATRETWARRKSDELAALRLGMSLGTVEGRRVDVVAAIAEYITTHGNRGTVESKRRVLEAMAEWASSIGVKSLADLSAVRLMGWRDHVLKPDRDGHQASTRNRWLVTGGIFLRWALRRGYVPLLTGDSIKAGTLRMKEPRREVDYLTPPELRTLLQACIDRDAEQDRDRGLRARPIAPVVLVLLLSGMRLGEIVNLTWDRVDAETGEIRLRAEDTKTKAARTITTAESPALRQLLGALRASRGKFEDGEVIFKIKRNSAFDAAARQLMAAGAPKFSAHVLRRTCGTIITNAPGIAGAASAWVAAKRLGHSVTMAEAHYLGLLRDLPADAKTIEAAVGIENLCQIIVEQVEARGGARKTAS